MPKPTEWDSMHGSNRTKSGGGIKMKPAVGPLYHLIDSDEVLQDGVLGLMDKLQQVWSGDRLGVGEMAMVLTIFEKLLRDTGFYDDPDWEARVKAAGAGRKPAARGTVKRRVIRRIHDKP